MSALLTADSPAPSVMHKVGAQEMSGRHELGTQECVLCTCVEDVLGGGEKGLIVCPLGHRRQGLRAFNLRLSAQLYCLNSPLSRVIFYTGHI